MMPVVLLERLPLPSLQTYTTFSVVLLACAICFAHQSVTDSGSIKDEIQGEEHRPNRTLSAFEQWDNYFTGILDVLMKETWCVWTLINMAYCCMILIGKTIQNMVFGELRVSEQQHIRDKFWNFVFYKFIFIFGVMNVQNMDEVVMWCGWFSMIGFLHLLAQLCKDRFEYLSFSPTTPKWTHIRVLALLGFILVVCGLLIAVCIFVGIQTSFNTFAFMVAECILLIVSTLYVLVRYGIHLWDTTHEGVWENRSIYVYYSELIFELAALSVDFTHHLHMLIWSNIFLSMASLVICMQLRYLFYEFQRRIKRHKNYLCVVRSMKARFAYATAEDLEGNDDCAICWDKMEQARKLPCGHLFHNSCLRSWLEQDTTCPTCRTSLSDPDENKDNEPVRTERGAGDADTQDEINNPNQTTNHFFHFDGSRYISWFPSFSVEVTHTQRVAHAQQETANHNSQLDHMARQVQGVFPHMSLEVLRADLQSSQSVEQTIENILEGRLIAPPTSAFATLTTTSPLYAESNISDDDLSYEERVTHTDSVTTSQVEPHQHRLDTNFLLDHNLPEPRISIPQRTERIEMPVAPATGFRFSKSSTERETMLASRKEDLLQIARRRFLAKAAEPIDATREPEEEEEQESVSTEEHTDDLLEEYENEIPVSIDRRELAYQAARRRMELSKNLSLR